MFNGLVERPPGRYAVTRSREVDREAKPGARVSTCPRNLAADLLQIPQPARYDQLLVLAHTAGGFARLVARRPAPIIAPAVATRASRVPIRV